MANYKKLVFFMLLFFLFSSTFTTNASASGSSMNIKVSASKYANLYYEVLENGQKIDKPIEFDVYKDNEPVKTFRTKKEILLIKKVPFGTYELKPKGYETSFKIKVDEEYLKTQHILKQLELNEKTTSKGENNSIQNPKTGDNSKGLTYLFIFLLSGLLLIIIAFKKARSEQHENK